METECRGGETDSQRRSYAPGVCKWTVVTWTDLASFVSNWVLVDAKARQVRSCPLRVHVPSLNVECACAFDSPTLDPKMRRSLSGCMQSSPFCIVTGKHHCDVTFMRGVSLGLLSAVFFPKGVV